MVGERQIVVAVIASMNGHQSVEPAQSSHIKGLPLELAMVSPTIPHPERYEEAQERQATISSIIGSLLKISIASQFLHDWTCQKGAS